MKNLVFVVLLVIVAGVGFLFMNNATEEDVATNPVDHETATEESMITPVDMSEEAQNKMYVAIADYNKCMMQNRLEYHQQGVKIVDVADKTLAACEPHLDVLADVLAENNVNQGLAKKMVHTMRSRAARKLMSAMMQSIAGQSAAMSNVAPETE